MSMFDQSYPNLEYYVQDGGSSDGTIEIIKRYADRLTGWDSRPDNGQSQAINLGFAKTSGEIMAWLNSDDILLPGALSCVAEYFRLHPEVDVIYGYRVLIDEDDQEIGRWILPAHDDEVLRGKISSRRKRYSGAGAYGIRPAARSMSLFVSPWIGTCWYVFAMRARALSDCRAFSEDSGSTRGKRLRLRYQAQVFRKWIASARKYMDASPCPRR